MLHKADSFNLYTFSLCPHSWELMHAGKGATFTHNLKSSYDHTIL